MRIVMAVAVSVLCVGFTGTAPARTMQDTDGPPARERPAASRLSQNLPSNVEQQMGIRPNSANRGNDRGNGRGNARGSDRGDRRGRGGGSDFEERRGYSGDRRGYSQDRRGGYYEERRGQRGGGPEVERCEGIAEARGLFGRDFSRFVRGCLGQ